MTVDYTRIPGISTDLLQFLIVAAGTFIVAAVGFVVAIAILTLGIA